MTKRLNNFFLLSTICEWILTLNSCTKDEQATGTDKVLFEMAKVTGDFKWFKNSSTLLAKSNGSGHPQALLRTRYNSVAATKIDSNGKINTGAVFPQGSLIVKELYENSTTLSRYAILYKNSSSVASDVKGWIWGYINSDGSVAEPASKKGVSCISCHSQTDNIDYMLMNEYFR